MLDLTVIIWYINKTVMAETINKIFSKGFYKHTD